MALPNPTGKTGKYIIKMSSFFIYRCLPRCQLMIVLQRGGQQPSEMPGIETQHACLHAKSMVPQLKLLDSQSRVVYLLFIFFASLSLMPPGTSTARIRSVEKLISYLVVWMMDYKLYDEADTQETEGLETPNRHRVQANSASCSIFVCLYHPL